MRRFLILLALSAVLSPDAASAAEAKKNAPAKKPVIMLSLNTGRAESETSFKGRSRRVRTRGTETKSVSTVTSYEGRISCKPPPGETCTVTLEAFFVTRKLGGSGVSLDKIHSSRTIGTYTFSDTGSSRSQTFSFKSPEVTRSNRTVRSGSRNRQRIRTSSSGTMYCGCFVRAVCDGKIVAVRASPGNSAWERAGRQSKPDLSRTNRL